MFDKSTELMREGLSEFSIGLSGHRLHQFCQYFELSMEQNRVMNLAAVTEPKDVVTKRFVDSLSLAKAASNLSDEKILDMGAGTGFLGISLRIAFPELKVTLLDSLNKRINFLDEVIGQLRLGEIQAVHGRAEDYGRDKLYREQYGYCVSRAVTNFSTLSEHCMPCVKIKGAFIPYRSGKIGEELNQAEGAVKLLSGKIKGVVTFVLPKTDVEWSLVIVRKTEGTSKKYPREAGLPNRELSKQVVGRNER